LTHFGDGSRVSVGIQGEPGSNSARAVELLLGPTSLECFHTFSELFEAFGQTLEQAVVPLQNSIVGLIGEVADGVLHAPTLSIRSQLTLPIEFVVAVLPGHEKHVKRVLVHPVAAAQCHRFLASTEWELVPCHDTAGSARLVRESKEGSIAALCPPMAAKMYSLEVIRTEVTNSPNSATRFLHIEAKATPPGPDDDRCLLALRPGGSLSQRLAQFAAAGVELLSVTSRPLPSTRFENVLLLDVAKGAQTPEVQRLCAQLGDSLRVLGSFVAGGT
jgi:prephenate dehydratase